MQTWTKMYSYTFDPRKIKPEAAPYLLHLVLQDSETWLQVSLDDRIIWEQQIELDFYLSKNILDGLYADDLAVNFLFGWIWRLSDSKVLKMFSQYFPEIVLKYERERYVSN